MTEPNPYAMPDDDTPIQQSPYTPPVQPEPENIANQQFQPPVNTPVQPVFVDTGLPAEDDQNHKEDMSSYPQYDPNAVQQQTQYPQVTQESKEQVTAQLNVSSSKSEYDIYSLQATNMTPEQWASIPNDPSNFVQYWSSSSAFDSYTTNSRDQKKFNSPIFAIFFLCQLFTGFVMMCCVTHSSYHAAVKTLKGSTVSLSILVTFAVCLAALFYFFMSHLLFPKFFVSYGILAGFVFQFLLVFIFMAWKVWYWIGPVVSFAILCVFFWFVSRGKDEFNVKIVGFLNMYILNKAIPLIFIILSITFISFVFVFAVYTSYGAYGNKWNGFGQFYLILSLWYTMNVFGNCFYMIAGSLIAKQYFALGTPEKDDLFFAVKRAFTYNLGVAAKAALVLPITEWAHFLATIEPASLSSDLLNSYPTVVKLMRELLEICQKVGIFVSKPLDKIFHFPSRRGLVYCAMFGIDFRDGCERYAEVCSKRHAHIAELQYTVDTMWLIRCFMLEIALYMVCFLFGPKCVADGIGSGRGFFLSFMLLYTLRSVLRGAAEALFVCFGEEPRRADNFYDGLSKELSEAFIAADRSRATGGMSSEAMIAVTTQSSNPYATV